MIASLPPVTRDSYLYYGSVVTATATATIHYYDYGYSHVNAVSISYGEELPPPPTRGEQRKIWSREAIVARTGDLRRHPPEVIERPRQRSRFRRATRSMASRWRVLQ